MQQKHRYDFSEMWDSPSQALPCTPLVGSHTIFTETGFATHFIFLSPLINYLSKLLSGMQVIGKMTKEMAMEHFRMSMEIHIVANGLLT